MRQSLRISFMLVVSLLAGCASVPEFAPADLAQDGWSQRTGQAVWRPADSSRPRLIGDLLLATRDNGDLLVNFVKAPIPLFTARVEDGRWNIRFVERDRAYGGRGKPPRKRFIWFALPQILAGQAPPRPWQLTRPQPNIWLLEQPKSGESLRLVLAP